MKALLILVLTASGHAAEPEEYRARVERAEALALDGRHDEALRELDAAIKLRPDDERAWLVRARALAWSGRHGAALAIYDRWPDKTRIERAAVEGFIRNRLHAERFLSAIVRDEPDNVNARLALADMHAWTEDGRTARRYYEEVVAISSGNATARRGLRRLREARRPRLSVAPAFFSNSGGLRRAGAAAGLWLRPLDNLDLGLLYEREAFRERGRRALESDAGGIGLRWRHGLRWTAEADGMAETFSDGPSVASGRAFVSFLADERVATWAGWRRAGPAAGSRFDQTSLETARRRIQADDMAAGAQVTPGRFRILGEARYAVYRRSDNERRSATAQAVYRPLSWVEAGYDFHWFDARRADPLYFSPRGYAAHGVVARLHRDANGFGAELSDVVFYQPASRRWGHMPTASLRLRRGAAEAAVDGSYVASEGPRFVSRRLAARLSCRF